MLIPLVCTLVAITLLPVVLSKFGQRLDWPHRRTDDRASRAWTRWAESVVRRRWIAAGSAVADPRRADRRRDRADAGRREPRTRSPSRATRRQGLTALEDSGIGSGALLPYEVLTSGTSPDQVATRSELRSQGVHGAVAPRARRSGAPAEWPRCSPSRPTTTRRQAGQGHPRPRPRRRPIARAPTCRSGGLPAQNADFIERRLRQLPADDRADRAWSRSSCWRGRSARCCCR